MLDFRELGADGRGLEQLIRELAFALQLDARWSGVGPDDERDLILGERGSDQFGSQVRNWLVSAKDFSHANEGKGRAVGLTDISLAGGIRDALDQHQSDAFLLVCTTYPSAALVRRLEEISTSRRFPIHVWDGVALQRLLDTPRGWAIAQRFTPISAEARGWKVFATSTPNRYIGVTRGMYFRLSNRIGGAMPEFQLSSVDRRMDVALSHDLPKGHELRLRGIFYDDKNGVFVSHWDYLWEGDPPDEDKMERLADMLGDGRVQYDDGQIDEVSVVAHRVFRGSDRYDRDRAEFYQQLPSYW